MEITVAEQLIETLIAAGVKRVYGIVGDSLNAVTEAIRQRQDKIQWVQVRHEEAAAFAAQAEDLQFPAAEGLDRGLARVGRADQHAAGQRRHQRGAQINAAGEDRADPLDDMHGRLALEDVPARTGAYGRDDGFIILGHREDQHGNPWNGLSNAMSRHNPTGVGQVEIHNYDVGSMG